MPRQVIKSASPPTSAEKACWLAYKPGTTAAADHVSAPISAPNVLWRGRRVGSLSNVRSSILRHNRARRSGPSVDLIKVLTWRSARPPSKAPLRGCGCAVPRLPLRQEVLPLLLLVLASPVLRRLGVRRQVVVRAGRVKLRQLVQRREYASHQGRQGGVLHAERVARRRPVRTAWHAKEIVRSIYDFDDPDLALEYVTRLGADLQDGSCPPEINMLGRTITRWRHEIAAWHTARLTNAATEAANNLIKRVKRVAFGFKVFRNFRVRAPALRRPTQLGPTRRGHTPLIRGEPVYPPNQRTAIRQPDNATFCDLRVSPVESAGHS